MVPGVFKKKNMGKRVINRRTYLKYAGTLGGMLAAGVGYGSNGVTKSALTGDTARTGIATVASGRLYALFSSPVRLRAIRFYRQGGDALLEVESTEGAIGRILGNARLDDSLSLLSNLVAPFILEQDLRDLPTLYDAFYYHERVYKYSSLPLWNAYGHVEAACLDMLGHLAQCPVHRLLGSPLRSSFPVYLSSLRRDTSPEEECGWLAARVAATGARAIKLKIGGRMSKNQDASLGRTDALVPLARRTFGDDMTIYVDANGSYDAPKAISVGRMLEANGVAFMEEPCEWEDFAATLEVAKSLSITIAGGEQDFSLPKWKWMLEQGAIGLAQPDLMYNGGIYRSLQVADMAAAAGTQVTPHCPHSGAAFAPLLHFAAVTPNLGPFQEMRAKEPKITTPYMPLIACANGEVAVPQGVGMGVTFDPDALAKMSLIWKT
jgi:L-alanine-DL-glutamate epimerase-like enolase superfamily enzyme